MTTSDSEEIPVKAPEAPEEPVKTPEESATANSQSSTESASGVEAPAIKSAKAPRTQKQLDVLAKARVKAAETIKARKASREALRKSPQVLSESPQVLSESPQVLSESPQVLSETPQVLSESPPVFTGGASIRSEEESPVQIISQRAHRQDIKRSITMSREELDQLLEESSTRTYNKLKIIDAPQPKLIYNSELGVYTYLS
jgi:hypothetical protein